MKKSIFLILLLPCFALGEIPAELEEAIRGSSLEKVRQSLSATKLSEVEKFALLDLAQEVVVRRRGAVEIFELRRCLGECSDDAMTVSVPVTGIVLAIGSVVGGGLLSIACTVSPYFGDKESIPYIMAWAGAGAAFSLLLAAIDFEIAKEENKKQKSIRAAYENAVKIKQLLFQVINTAV